MSERKPGWYWVRGSETEGTWVPWEWVGESEMLVARWADGGRRWIDEVGPRIPTPDEPWQCVPVESTWQMEGVADIDPYDYQQILAVAPKP